MYVCMYVCMYVNIYINSMFCDVVLQIFNCRVAKNQHVCRTNLGWPASDHLAEHKAQVGIFRFPNERLRTDCAD